jgi:hypothetical protein
MTMTCRERDDLLTSERAVLQGEAICAGCKRRQMIHQQYRCYDCGLYYCEICAPEHFGERPNRSINRPDHKHKEDGDE